MFALIIEALRSKPSSILINLDYYMKKILFSIFSIFILLTAGAFAQTSGTTVIEDFESYKNPFLYKNWKMRHAWKLNEISLKKTSEVYTIKQENGNRFLHASTESNYKNSILLVRLVNNHKVVKDNTVNWKLKSQPWLSWRWRAHKLPKGAYEKKGRSNDSAAAIYVIFQRMNIPFLPWNWQPIDTLQYVWSSSIPAGSEFSKKNKKFGITLYRGKFFVLQSGTKKTGQWITEKRNIYRDYRKRYGHWPKNEPILIAIITDSDKTKSSSAADYDDIKIGAK